MAAAVVDSPLTKAIKDFDAAESNLAKLEQLWSKIKALIPASLDFDENAEHEECCRDYKLILDALPKIEGWKPESRPMDLHEIATNRLDVMDLGELEYEIAVERSIEAPGRELREYRSRLNKKRRQLVRQSLIELIAKVDENIRLLRPILDEDAPRDSVRGDEWYKLKSHVEQITALMGSSFPRPKRWSDLNRHLGFGLMEDLRDIIQFDWPTAKSSLEAGLYESNEPVPVAVADLSTLVDAKPTGPVATQLHWDRLDAEGFERLMYNFIVNEPGYENAEWLTNTNAADRGRDLSVYQVIQDPLLGTLRKRVIIQCRHQSASINLSDIALREQMKTWEPPRVDVLIIATTGRFTTDAVSSIEKHNQSDTSLQMVMWPESHLEYLLASRPALVAEFNLR